MHHVRRIRLLRGRDGNVGVRVLAHQSEELLCVPVSEVGRGAVDREGLAVGALQIHRPLEVADVVRREVAQTVAQGVERARFLVLEVPVHVVGQQIRVGGEFLHDVVDQLRLRLTVPDRRVGRSAVVRVARRGGLQGVAEGVGTEVVSLLRRFLIREEVDTVPVDRPLEVLVGEQVEVGLEVRLPARLDRPVLVVRRGLLREELLGCLGTVSQCLEHAVQRVVAGAELPGGVETVPVLGADGPVGQEAVGIVLVELGHVFRDAGQERGIVVPVAEQAAQDLVAVGLAPHATLPFNLLGAQFAELRAPPRGQVLPVPAEALRGVGVGGVGQCVTHVLLQVPHSGQARLRGVLVRSVDCHRAVELECLPRPAQTLEELGRELAVLLPPVVPEQPVQLGEFAVGEVLALLGECQGAFDLRVVEGVVLRVAGVVEVVAVCSLERQFRGDVNVVGVRELACDGVRVALPVLLRVVLAVLLVGVRRGPEPHVHRSVGVVLDGVALALGLVRERPDALLERFEFTVRVIQDPEDAFGLPMEVRELLGGLVHELACDAGVQAFPTRAVGLLLEAVTGVGLKLAQVADHLLPVRDCGAQLAEIDLHQVVVGDGHA